MSFWKVQFASSFAGKVRSSDYESFQLHRDTVIKVDALLAHSTIQRKAAAGKILKYEAVAQLRSKCKMYRCNFTNANLIENTFVVDNNVLKAQIAKLTHKYKSNHGIKNPLHQWKM